MAPKLALFSPTGSKNLSFLNAIPFINQKWFNNAGNTPSERLYTFLWSTTTLRWGKARSSYTTNSWIYTTNHKRIAINYFIFVLVAGTAGMSLSSIIRL